MIDVPNRGFIDSHAEGDRCNNDIPVGCHPPFLNFRPLFGLHPGVIRPRGIAGVFQHRRNPLSGPLESYINNCAARSTATEAIQEKPVTIGIQDGRGADLEVRSVKAGDDRTLFRNTESRTNIFDDRWRRCCSQRQDAFGLQLSGDCREFQIIRAEVVSPFGDAVRLIDCEQRDIASADCFKEALVIESFRSDI